jgi:hypothetical protein
VPESEANHGPGSYLIFDFPTTFKEDGGFLHSDEWEVSREGSGVDNAQVN